jgi:asparagine synthase (glutamine-hydrolysing)
MHSPDGRYCITYNGEIFNFVELRHELEQKGRRFMGSSDTEVLLAAYATWGEGMLDRLNGMWAFAIWDAHRRELFLARDRFGIKPLHYLHAGARFAFASELKAFRALDGHRARLDEEAARVVLREPFRIEGSRRTLLESVRRLQAGHCLTLSADGRPRLRRWWNTLDRLPAVPATTQARADRFHELFSDAVRVRMRSDVPLGTCLSGGFDSTAVLSTMADLGRPSEAGERQAADWQHAFVATFPGAQNDERPQAEEAARFAGVQPHFLSIDGSHALHELERMLFDFDDIYISMPNAPWLIYRELRRHAVVVSLDGHGADELMGGYKTGAALYLGDAPSLLSQPAETLRRVGLMRGLMGARAIATGLLREHPSFRPLLGGLRRLRTALPRRARDDEFLLSGPESAGADFDLPWEQDALPDAWGSVNRELYAMFHSTTLPTILRNFDRTSMAHGVEVRMPFMDWRLVTYAMALPDAEKIGEARTKRVARLAMKGRMPESIRDSRVKVGFNSPMPEWLAGPLRPWVEALMDEVRDDPLVDVEKLRRLYRQRAGAGAFSWANYASTWLALNYLWFRRSLDGPAGLRP